MVTQGRARVVLAKQAAALQLWHDVAHEVGIAAGNGGRGDDIITGGGIRGRVVKVTDDEAEVEIAAGVKVRVMKSTISSVVQPKTKPAND